MWFSLASSTTRQWIFSTSSANGESAFAHKLHETSRHSKRATLFAAQQHDTALQGLCVSPPFDVYPFMYAVCVGVGLTVQIALPANAVEDANASHRFAGLVTKRDDA